MRDPLEKPGLTVLIPDSMSDEFLRLCSEPSTPIERIGRALRVVGVITNKDVLLWYADLSNWRRGGAETYVSEFLIRCVSCGVEMTMHVIAKAIIKWGIPPDRAAAEWVRRQSQLQKFEVRTPRTFGYCEGILFQQFIPFGLSEYFGTADRQQKAKLADQLVHLAAKVDEAGFYTTDLVSNLRVDEDAVILLTDFGEDLGGYVIGRCGSKATRLAEAWLGEQASAA